MAESITFNNAVYIIPDVGESNWGQNLTNYFVAIPQGAYQASGGTLPLTADLSFGTNFGLFTKYVTSITANPASAGVIRLANTESIDWRNAANNANLALTVNASNQLTFNGNIIPTDPSAVTAKSFLYGDASGLIASTSNPTNGQLLIGSTGAIPAVAALTGTTSQVIVTNGAGTITLSTPQNIDSTATPTFASETLTATTNQIVLGTTHTTTISSTAPSASRVYTIPDAGGAANVVLDTGNYTIGGTWSFSNTITLASSKAIIFTDNSTNTVTLKATNSTTSWTLSLPTTHGSSNQFLQTDGSGNTTWAPGGSGTIASGTTNGIALYTAATTVGSTAAPTNGQILVGSTSNPPVLATITGTANKIGITNGAGTITITTLPVAPTVQSFTSGSGTYTTPTSPGPLYLRVRMVGPGGGGSGGGTGGNNGSGGSGATTFSAGAASAGAGGGGSFGSGGGAGGSNSISTSGTIIAVLSIAGGTGQGADFSTISGSVQLAGSIGGSTPLGGGGTGTVGTGNAGRANTGEGGGGGRSGPSGLDDSNGSGGGGGGFIEYLITSPSATYTYSIGTGGAGGTSTTGSGSTGGAGASGVVVVEEYYQ